MNDIIKGHAEFIKSLETLVKTLNSLLASEEQKWTILEDRVKNIIDIIDK